MRVAPLDMPLEQARAELDRLRTRLRIAVFRAKNPFNVGAIIRVAHSFLVREILLIGDAPYYEKASMGMHRYENIVQVATEEAFLAHAKKEKWRLVVFEKDHSQVGLWEADIPEECVMVFGNENTGVSERTLQAADQVVAIPMYGINHSYPLSIAAGIAMAEWARRHHQTVGQTAHERVGIDPSHVRAFG